MQCVKTGSFLREMLKSWIIWVQVWFTWRKFKTTSKSAHLKGPSY